MNYLFSCCNCVTVIYAFESHIYYFFHYIFYIITITVTLHIINVLKNSYKK